MRHRNWLGSLRIAAAACALSAATAALAEEGTVAVSEAPVRGQASLGAAPVGILKYGDIVTILEKPNDAWRRVESKPPLKIAGWMRTSHLTARSLNTSVASAGTKATAGEITDASKGLLEKGEQNYVNKNNLAAAMKQVDQIEQNSKAEISEIQSFLTAGGLKPAGGN